MKIVTSNSDVMFDDISTQTYHLHTADVNKLNVTLNMCLSTNLATTFYFAK